MFFSTRNSLDCVSASKAILKGISDDGGLYVPEKIPSFILKEEDLKKSYKEIAYEVLKSYFDDFNEEELKSCIEKAYSKENFNEKTIGIKSLNHYSFLELFYGPTITFKDMALSLLPYLLEVSKEKNKIKNNIKVLTATSGDTGSAALSNFKKTKGVEIYVLYPDRGVSPLQEKQMLYFTSPSSRAFALRFANFDDCQNLVKKTLNTKSKKYYLTSANSINIGRLLPQIVYYYYSYISLVNNKEIKFGDKIDVVVPTGNFGNILSCYFAKKMGLPINKLVCASNKNSVLTDFFKTGIYDCNRTFYKTNSPSMDILVSSNLERLLYLISEDSNLVASLMKDLKEKKKFVLPTSLKEKLNDFVAYSTNEDDTLKDINELYKKEKYLIDPHTAVAFGAYKKFLPDKIDKNYVMIVATASPYKFPVTITKALGIKVNDEFDAIDKIEKYTKTKAPIQFIKAINNEVPPFKIKTNDFPNTIFKRVYLRVKTCATSANLGCAFDTAGLPLNLFNDYSFSFNTTKPGVFGFSKVDTKDNLIMKSYRYTLKKYNYEEAPLSITLVKQNIPESRGLGSSASCIVAGVYAANEYMNRALSREQMFECAVEIEGHPDNVAPCLYEVMMTAMKMGDEYFLRRFAVSNSLNFILCIPNIEVKTSYARSVLPKEVEFRVAKELIGRAMNLSYAFEKGDLKLIKEVTKDELHTPYRIKLIPDGEKIREIADKYGLPFVISGSGPTTIIITKDLAVLDELKKTKFKSEYEFKVVKSINDTIVVRRRYV